LIHAATSSRAEIVKVLLNGKADPNAKDNQGRTALSHAAQSSTLSETIVALLGAKADPNIADENGFTPLSYATPRGPETVKPLIEAQADVNVVDRHGLTPLSRANGNTNVVKLLLEANADPNLGTSESPLLQAVRADNAILTEMLLRAGANPNQETECALYNFVPAGARANLPGMPPGSISSEKRRVPTGQRGKRTPLQVAVFEDRPTMVKLLLQFKGDAKATDADGFPLVLSALGSVESLKALLEAGADANAVDDKGQAALITAARTGNSEAIDLLLKHGAKTEVRGDQARTPLFSAIQSGCLKCVETSRRTGCCRIGECRRRCPVPVRRTDCRGTRSR
jgi:ankyrin repeat protein